MSRDQSTMTEHPESSNRRFCRLTTKEILSHISSLFLPLMLGVFTAVITFHQQNVGVKQRLEDREIAREQREQDRNISREQREQDKTIAKNRLRDAVLVAYLNGYCKSIEG